MAYKYGQQLCDRPSYLHRWWRGEPAPTRASVRLNHHARAWSWNTRTRPLLLWPRLMRIARPYEVVLRSSSAMACRYRTVICFQVRLRTAPRSVVARDRPDGLAEIVVPLAFSSRVSPSPQARDDYCTLIPVTALAT